MRTPALRVKAPNPCFVATVFVTLLAAFMAAAAHAQVPPARALFMDLEKVFLESAVGKNIRQQLETQLADIGAREEAAKNDFEAREAALMANPQGLPEAELRNDWDTLQTEKTGAASLYQLERTAIQAAATEARRKVNAELNTIMQEVLAERGANMIVSTAAVLVGGVDYDVTAEVIARLDKRLPTLDVALPN